LTCNAKWQQSLDYFRYAHILKVRRFSVCLSITVVVAYVQQINNKFAYDWIICSFYHYRCCSWWW